ncbi:MAG: CerR family C-terminal domain-containing protein [Kiritimatiellae bacterium]|nr:CerR family C-terminal domain-containing protein [Kiritimatiellia bacterium]
MERRDGQNTREAILVAATEEFAEKGYDGASLRGICVRAGVNIALANRYFGSKEALYKRVAQRLFGDLGSPLANLADGVDSQSSWKKAIETWVGSFLYMTTTTNRPQSLCAKLFRHEVTHPSKFQMELKSEFGRPVYHSLRSLVSMAVSDEEQIDLRTASIWAQVAVYALADSVWLESFRPSGVPLEEWAEKLCRQICEDVFAQLKYRGES